MSSDQGLHPFVVQYDELLSGPIDQFHQLSSSIGGIVREMADKAISAIRSQRQFLVVASKSRQPNQQDILVNLLRPTSDAIQAVQAFREKHRATEWFNHLSAISESISALGWVTVSPTPGPFVKEMKDAAQFYTNKVLVAFKDKDKNHIEWAKTWIEFLNQLQAYIKQFHTTGLTWNVKGIEASAVASNGSSVPPPPPIRGGSLPPPPPPPPSADIFNASSAPPSGDDARLALMRELNRGTDITSGLKKVTDDQKTHKNPALKSQGIVSASDLPAGRRQEAVQKAVPAKPPKFELEGKKWLVEYQNGAQNLVIAETEMNQSVNLYKCKDTVVQVKGKINSITVDSCVKTAVVFEDIVSVVEFINCQSIQAQVSSYNEIII
jgi:adenylyl cyclase-associated protein